MDNEDRQKILQNIDRLIQCTKYDALMEQCMKRGLLFDVMQEQIEVRIYLPMRFCRLPVQKTSSSQLINIEIKMLDAEAVILKHMTFLNTTFILHLFLDSSR